MPCLMPTRLNARKTQPRVPSMRCCSGSSSLRPKADHLQHRLALPLQQYNTLVISEGDPPYRVPSPTELPHKGARPEVPKLDAAIVPAGNDKPLVELKACHRIVMCAQAVDAGVGREVEGDDATVGSARDERVSRQLQLPDERSVTLQHRCALATRIRDG